MDTSSGSLIIDTYQVMLRQADEIAFLKEQLSKTENTVLMLREALTEVVMISGCVIKEEYRDILLNTESAKEILK